MLQLPTETLRADRHDFEVWRNPCASDAAVSGTAGTHSPHESTSYHGEFDMLHVNQGMISKVRQWPQPQLLQAS